MWNPFIETFLNKSEPITHSCIIATEEREFKSVVEALAPGNNALKYLRPQTDKTSDP